MQWCVVSALAVVCLTGHVLSLTHAGHAPTHVQMGTDADTHNATLPEFDVDGRGLLDITDRRWNASQSSLQEVPITETSQEVTVTPVTSDHHLVSPQDHDAHHAVITPPQHDFISTDQNTSTSRKDNITITTTHTNTTTTVTSGGRGNKIQVKAIVLDPALEDGRVPGEVDQLVICSCPEMTPDGCQRFLSNVTIDSKDYAHRDIRIPVEDLNVVVHNVTCLKKDHRLRNFTEGQFYHRERGDLVLTDAGDLAGLRVSDYCADLRQDKNQEMKWNIKICIPPPSVPRCCPSGQALRNGVCKEATTPAILAPPLSAGSKGKYVYWPVIRNNHQPLNCTKYPLTSIPLDPSIPSQSYLLSLPDGIIHIWDPPDGCNKVTYSPDLCIDGYVDTYGSVVYSVNICYSHPEDLHHEVCDGHLCVRKCCPYGEEMDETQKNCVPSNATSYKPHFTVTPSNYTVVEGEPLCCSSIMVDNATLDSRGRLYYNNNHLSAKDYCVDKFTDGRGMHEDKALVCIKESNRLWFKVRKIAFPLCQMISMFFLLVTMSCYCVVPNLLQGGGWYHFFHVLSLFSAYSIRFTHSMFSDIWEETTCLIMGIVLQVCFLATFFWLNILCFDVWRKIRSLTKYRSASVIPMWVYILYGYGVPLAIGAMTLCIHLLVPHDVPGLIKPNFTSRMCFFLDADSKTAYFYGPMAILFALNVVFVTHTYWMYRSFEKNSSKLREKSHDIASTNKMTTEHIHCKRDYISEFKQQFSLLVLISSCWVAEILSYFIPPLEMWAPTDIFNCLQGFFIFLIFLANTSKRKHLKKKFPKVFKMANHLKHVIGECCCPSDEGTCLHSANRFTSQIRENFSSIASNLSTLSTTLKYSTSSVSITSPDNEHDLMGPSVGEPDIGIAVLSHSSIKSKSNFPSENAETKC